MRPKCGARESAEARAARPDPRVLAWALRRRRPPPGAYVVERARGTARIVQAAYFCADLGADILDVVILARVLVLAALAGAPARTVGRSYIVVTAPVPEGVAVLHVRADGGGAWDEIIAAPPARGWRE